MQSGVRLVSSRSANPPKFEHNGDFGAIECVKARHIAPRSVVVVADLPASVVQPRSRAPMYLPVKKPRKTDRKRSNRHRAKVKAKNRTRRARVAAN